MTQRDLAPVLGIVACVLVGVGFAVPYQLVGESSAVNTYYGTGAINPLIGGLFCLVAIILFAAGRTDRTDQALAAGASLSLGFVLVIVVAVWAATVPEEVVVGMGTNTLVQYHRWALLLVAAGVPLASGWYARTLGML
jgi:hypothetical protein